MRRWAALAVVIASVALGGCDAADRMRREFVATRYLQQAETHLLGLPRYASRGEQELDRVLELTPHDEHLRGRAGRLYVNARAWDKALELLRELPSPGHNERIMLAQCLLKTGATDDGAAMCVEEINRARRRHAEGRMDRGTWATVLNDAGYVLADAGVRLELAHDATRRATAARPLQAAFVDSLGWALLRLGRYREALFYLERARRLSPREDPELLYHVGVAYARLNRYGDAEDALTRARHLDPDFERIDEELRRLGRVLPRPTLAALADPSHDAHTDRPLQTARTGGDAP